MLPTRDEIIKQLQVMHKNSTLGQVADEILRMFETVRAFSQIVADMECWPEDEEGRKICPTCNQTCYWAKLTMKKRYVEALKIMYKEERSFTAKELAAYAKGGRPQDMGNDTYFRYFTEARHWGLIKPTGEERDRCGCWEITEQGIKFLRKEIAVDSFILKLKGKDTVRRDGDADPIYCDQVVEDDPDELSDGAQHFHNAQPAL